MVISQLMVSTFPSIYETENPTQRPLIEVLDEMKNPGEQLERIVSTVRGAKSTAEQDRLKVMLLPILCPSGTFSKRADSALVQYNGVICLDLDDTVDTVAVIEMAKQFPHTLATMLSPTGKGVKLFVLTDLQDSSRHSDLYHHLGNIMGYTSRPGLKFDPSCSNPSRACFFSVDKRMYINRNATPYHVDLDILPVYTPAAKTPTVTSSIPEEALYNPSFPSPITDMEAIRDAIVDTHSLFEEYHAFIPGQRNRSIYLLAFFFRLDGIPEDAATDYLVAYYNDPAGDFTADEIKRTVKSVYSR